jgi:hypothetical protein
MCISSHSCYNVTHVLNFHIALCECCSLLYTVGHAEQEQEEYGGPQASSYKDTNIPFLSKRQASVHPTNISWLLIFNQYLYYSLIVH